MAIFHLSAVIHSRGKGHSAVAGAAYRARDEITDERTGEQHNYSRKSADVLFAGIYAPKDAPEWAHDRAQLWNHVEAFEKRRDAQLCRSFDIALPHELSLEQNRRLLQDWVRDNFTRKGLIADVAIHAPHRGRGPLAHTSSDPRNIHAHVAVVLRKLDGTEFAAKKERTATNDERLAELESWRASWEKLANRHLERAGVEARIDRRTLKEQGIDAEPTKHLGATATKMEREGTESDRGDINRDITDRNAGKQKIAALEAEVAAITAQIIDFRAAQEKHGAGPTTPAPVIDFNGGSKRKKKMAIERDDMDDDISVKQRKERQADEDREAAIYNDMVAGRNQADRFIQDWQRNHDYGERNKRDLQHEQWRRAAESDIVDVHVRAMIAAGDSRDFVQSVRREGAMITEEHAALSRDIALEKDPDKKHLLELKRDIEHADYMALSNERIAAMSNLNSEQYKEAIQQQGTWASIGTDLRKERLELREHMADREAERANEDATQPAAKVDAADRQRAEFRADIRGSQPAAQPDAHAFDPMAHPDEPAMRAVARMLEAERAAEQDNSPLTRDLSQTPAAPRTEAERPAAEVIFIGPNVPHEPQRAGSVESSTAENVEIADSKAAKKAALAQMRAETEQSIQQREPERGAALENTDARQANSAENVEITDSKAAKKAALAQMRTETEQSIAQAHERGYEHSR